MQSNWFDSRGVRPKPRKTAGDISNPHRVIRSKTRKVIPSLEFVNNDEIAAG